MLPQAQKLQKYNKLQSASEILNRVNASNKHMLIRRMHHKPDQMEADIQQTPTQSTYANTYTDQPRILGSARNLGLSIHTVLLITFTFCRCRC